jgi:hypothetical protein
MWTCRSNETQMNTQHPINIQHRMRRRAAFHWMFVVGCSLLDVSKGRSIALTLLLFAPVLNSQASFVYETPAEFLTSGDFNGDGRTDALVLDKVTGNARVGYQNVSGALDWFGPFATGADSATALAVGRFSQTNSEAIAVTAAGLNQIRILDFSNPSNAPSPVIMNPAHPDISLLVGLDAPYQTNSSLGWLNTASHDPGITLLDLFGFLGQSLSYFQDQIAADGYLSSGSAFRRFASDATLLAAVRRGSSNDSFIAYSYTNTTTAALVRSNLPAGTEYVFGNFNNEPYPRLLFYVPGQSNIIVQPLIYNGTDFAFGAATVNAFTSAVQRVFFVAEQTNGLAVVQFGNGVVGLRPPTSGGVLNVAYNFGNGSAGNAVSGVVPLGPGKFALISSASNSTYSTHAQIFTRDGSGNYVQTSSNTLSPVTSAATRGNVWLFQAEPFTTSAAVEIGSLNAPVWSSAVLGLPGSISVRVESDAGTTSGLGNPATNNFGAPPAGTAYALPNQYRDDVSFFGYAPARAADASVVTIAPPPGVYSGPITISFTKQNASDDVYYRHSASEFWQLYFSPFAQTNDATIEYYGSTLSGSRGRTQLAAYTLGNTGEAPHDPVILTNSVFTNPPPPINTNVLQIAASGTVFYGRRNTNNNFATIWAINLDGSGETYITTGRRPRVSHDGHWMSFLRDNDPVTNQFSLWLRDLTTGTETRLHSSSNRYVSHDWEPDNATIVFDNNCLFWRIGTSGPAMQLPLPSDCRQAAPALNPLDGRLAFQIIYPGSIGLYLAPSNAASKQNFNLSVLSPRWPAWSMDGKRIAIADDPNISPIIDAGHNLWIVDVVNTNVHQITALTGNDGFPDGAIWKSDGRGLVGAGTIGATNGLWIIPLASDGGVCHCPPILLPTSPGDPIEFAGSIITAQPAAVQVPGLFIRTEPNAVVVYWSTSYDGFILEFTTDVAPPSTWTQIDGPYFLNGGYYEYHEAKSALATKKFFRLRYPGIFFLTPTQAELSFELQSGQAVLTWPSDYVGYTLESATDLNPPALWTPVSGTYGVTNGHFEFRQNLLGTKPKEFFRLRWP